HRSLMAEILRRRTPLEVVQAAEGDRIRPGTVHIAPPDRHLLVNRDGSLSLSHSELVHFVRPSADLLFESVAASYGERAIAVVPTLRAFWSTFVTPAASTSAATNGRRWYAGSPSG